MAEPGLRVSLHGTAPRICLASAGSGEAVLFLHGLGSTKENWEDQLLPFSRSHFVAAWDARGYGGSDDYPEELAFGGDLSADLLVVLDEHRLERAHLVGLSMGGLIAQCFYFAHPGRVASLVLADTFPSFGALGPDTVSGFSKARLQPLLDGTEPADLAASAAASLMAAGAGSEAHAKLLASLSALRKGSYVKTIRALLAQQAPGRLEDIAVPTLVIVGELDRLSPVAVATAMAQRISGCELSVIPGAGHMSNMEQPAVFNRILGDFLARHADRASTASAR